MAAVHQVPRTSLAASPFKGRVWTTPSSAGDPESPANPYTPAAVGKLNGAFAPSPPATPSPSGKRKRLRKGARTARPRTAGSQDFHPPSPWLARRPSSASPRAGGKRRPQSAPPGAHAMPTAAEGAVMSPHRAEVEDQLVHGSAVFLGYERENVQYQLQQLHQLEQKRREREALLRRLRTESVGLGASLGAVVPTSVARMLELELRLDQALLRQHAQVLATEKATARIAVLQAKLTIKEARVVAGRQELAMVADEVDQRGGVLAELSNQAEAARDGLDGVQARVARERVARQQELDTLRSRLGVDALHSEIKELETQLGDLQETTAALSEVRGSIASREHRLQDLQEREGKQSAVVATLRARKRSHQNTRRAKDVRADMAALEDELAGVATDTAAREAELADIKQVMQQSAVVSRQLAVAIAAVEENEAAAAGTSGRKAKLEKQHEEELEALARLEGILTSARAEEELDERQVAQLRQEVNDATAELSARHKELDAELHVLVLEEATVRETIKSTEEALKKLEQKMVKNAHDIQQQEHSIADGGEQLERVHEAGAVKRAELVQMRPPAAVQADLDGIHTQMETEENHQAVVAEEMDVIRGQMKTQSECADQLDAAKSALNALSTLKAELEAKAAAAKTREIVDQQAIAEAEAKRDAAHSRADEVKRILDEATAVLEAKRAKITAEFDAGEQMHIEAIESLKGITIRQLEELRSMPHPPAGVELTLSAVMLIIGRGSKLPWTEIKQILHEKIFMADVMKFDQFRDSTVKHRALHTLQVEYIDDERFNVDSVTHASKAAGPLCAWVKSQVHLAHTSAHMKNLDAACLLLEMDVNEKREACELAMSQFTGLSHLVHDSIGVEGFNAEVLRLQQELAEIREFWRTHDEREAELAREDLTRAAEFKDTQAAYDAACMVLAASRTEGAIQQHLDRFSETAVELRKEAQKLELELQAFKDGSVLVEHFELDLTAAKEHVQRELEGKEALETERDDEFVEQQRLQAELDSALAVLDRDDTREVALRKELHDLSAAIKEKEAETQSEMDALAVDIGRSRHVITTNEAARTDLRHKLGENEDGQAEVEGLAHERNAQKAHEMAHVDLLAHLEMVRADARPVQALSKAQRHEDQVQADLRTLKLRPGEIKNASARLAGELAGLRQRETQDSILLKELLAALTDAETSLAKTTQETRELRIENSEDSKVVSALAHKSKQWNPARIQKRLGRLRGEVQLKTNDRTAMLDQTGAILPPHHFAPNQWTKEPPVGKTERLRCLSAGPSPNRAAAMRSKGFAADRGESKTLGPAADANATNAYQERLRLAWEAIVHATGVDTEEDITRRLLVHSAERGRLDNAVAGLDVQRAGLRHDVQNWHQQLQDVLHGDGSVLRDDYTVLDGSKPSRQAKLKHLPMSTDGQQQMDEQRTQLRDAEARLHSTEARVSTWQRLLSVVGPGLEHLARSCGPSVLTDLGVNVRDVTTDDAEASVLLMVERRICFVIEAMSSAGLSLDRHAVGNTQLGASGSSARTVVVDSPRSDGAAAENKGKGGKKKGRNINANVRVPSRAMLEQHVSREEDQNHHHRRRGRR